MGSRLRIGILGAARIAPNALCRPAADHDRVEVVAVAARERGRAESFAQRWSVPQVLEDYRALVEHPDLDAIYNPLPNGLHGYWTIEALRAGKHVLCEKPFAANAVEARSVAEAAAGTDRVVMEAFHWRYHPLAARVLELLADGAIGTVRKAEASFCFPLLKGSDIRWDLALAGGALMDAGCYPIHMLRTFLGSEPTVSAARVRERSPGVDRVAEAELSFPGGVSGQVLASMWSRHLLSIRVRLQGDDGELRILNPLAPQYGSRLTVRSGGSTVRERPPRSPTYAHQLDAFAAAVLDGAPFPTGTDDAVANMEVIDAIYRAAGLEPRRPTPTTG